MLLRHFKLDTGPLEANSYLMGDEATGKALLIDAGAYDERIPEQADDWDLTITHIVLTHNHWDHVDGLAEYLREWPATRVVSPKLVPGPVGVASEAFIAAFATLDDPLIVKPGDSLDLGPFQFQVFDTSGHTVESVSFYCAEQCLCFVGDAIFAGSVGGTRNDKLHAQLLANIRRDILTLPPETELLPGHGPMTTVEIETACNPFLQPGFTRQE